MTFKATKIAALVCASVLSAPFTSLSAQSADLQPPLRDLSVARDAEAGIKRVVTYEIVQPLTERHELVPALENKKRDALTFEGLLGEPLFFSKGSTSLDQTARVELNKIGEFILLKGDRKTRFLLVGQTDASGSAEQNVILSQKRALAVQAYLSNRFNLAPHRFLVMGAGAAYASVDGDRDGDIGNARRVTISVLRPERSQPDETGAQSVAVATKLNGTHCVLPAYPGSRQQIEGKVVSRQFESMDDYGGGRLMTVCEIRTTY